MNTFQYICNELILFKLIYMSTIQKLLELFRNKPYYITQGAGIIAKRNKCSIEEVKKAKAIYYNNININKIKQVPRILIVDIETSPMKAFVWSRWKQNIYLDQTISEWFMLCWSAKWLGEDKVYGERVKCEDVLKEDDSKIIRGLWELLDEADIVITHNGKRFDIPKINSRFLINELPPPSPYKQIDTLEVTKREFGFSSNKLDALLDYFGYEKKLNTSFELWKKCLEGDKESLDYMLTYNKKDVTQLELVYLKLRPYIKGHPNLGIYYDIEKEQCGHCASTELIFTGYTYSNVSKFSTYRCTKCGSISRKRTTENTINKRKNLLTTIN